MAENKLELRVVAPTMATDKSPYKINAKIDMAILRCTTGDMGILAGHIPVSMVLDIGILRIFDGDSESRVAVLGGIAHVSEDIITVLSDAALVPEEIDVKAIGAELGELLQRVEQGADEGEKQEMQRRIVSCRVLLEVKNA
ncbi:MAG: F0F1 ATP synthase subunit epsilon [Defluviitaleaceae bacterium]|nr:F0F1 ATP synthase subunit epsilon [Defluviitaleaceae bacterium]